MTPLEREEGALEVMLRRITKQRIPHALSLEKKVNRGQKLNDFDLEFLDTVVHDGQALIPLLNRHPEYQELAGKLMTLYSKIISQAAENEKIDM